MSENQSVNELFRLFSVRGGWKIISSALNRRPQLGMGGYLYHQGTFPRRGITCVPSALTLILSRSSPLNLEQIQVHEPGFYF